MAVSFGVTPVAGCLYLPLWDASAWWQCLFFCHAGCRNSVFFLFPWGVGHPHTRIRVRSTHAHTLNPLTVPSQSPFPSKTSRNMWVHTHAANILPPSGLGSQSACGCVIAERESAGGFTRGEGTCRENTGGRFPCGRST